MFLPGSAIQARAATFTNGYTIGSGLLGATLVDAASHTGLSTTDLRANDTQTGTGAYSWVAVWSNLWSVGDKVSLTGIAVPLRSGTTTTTNNTANGTFTFTFYQLSGGTDPNGWEGTSNGETVLGTATVQFVDAGSGNGIIPYAQFDSPIRFTATSQGIAVHMDSTSSIRTRRDETPDPEDGLEASRSTGVFADSAVDFAGHQWTLAGTAIRPSPRVNLAKYQKVVTDSNNGSSLAANVTDGFVTDTGGWVSDNSGPHWAQVDFPFPVTVGSAQLVLGLDNVAPPTAFSLQYLTNGNWVSIPGTTVVGNTNKDLNLVFTNPVTASAFRFYDSVDATVRLRELALYPPNGTNGYPFGTDLSIDLARKQPAFATTNTLGGWPLLAADGSVNPSSAWKTTLVGSNALQINLQFTNRIGSAHLYSGMTGVPPLTNFVLQYWTGSAWADIPGGGVTGNTNAALVIPFSTPVTTTKVQLVFTNGGVSAVQELCVFPANSPSGYPLGTGVIFDTPVTAKYDTYSDSYYYLSNAATGLVVVESNGVPGLGVPGLTDLTTQYQVLLNYDTGTYRLRNRGTGLFLSGAQLTTNAGAALVSAPYEALPDQDWYLQGSDGTNFSLVNQFSGLVLDATGGTLVQNVPSNSPGQRWQISFAEIYPKKGLGGVGNGNPVRYAADWIYGWWYTGNPNLPGVNWFPMDNDSWYRGSTVNGNIFGFLPAWRTADYSLILMGFNEPDKVDQANIDPTNAAIYWLNDVNMDLPLVGPAAANVNGSWNSNFFAYITNWGCRMDYLPGHQYPGPAGGSSGCWINPMQTAYNKYGIPMWLTEFGIVDWGGAGSWSEEDNYTALAEFLWRAESVSWLRKYALFLFKADTNSPMAPNPWTDTTPAPRSNTTDTNGNLTPFGELYAGWDNDASVRTNKDYFIYNSSTRKRLRNTLGSTANATDIRVSDFSTKWTLQPAPGTNSYYIVSERDHRRLSYVNGGSVSLVASNTTGGAVQWGLTEQQYGWFYLEHPATSKRLQLAFDNATSVATFTMAANTTTTNAAQWRFIVPLPAPVWLGYSSPDWTNSANWSSQRSPLTGQSVTFNERSISNLSTSLRSNFSLSGVTMTTPAGPVSIGGTNTLTIGSDGFDLSVASQNLTLTAPLLLSADQAWNVGSSQILSVNGGVSDNVAGANLTIDGGGKVSLGGAASHTGDTIINVDATLQLGAANVLPHGAGLGNLIVNGALDLNGRNDSINGLSGTGLVDNTGAGAGSLTVGYNDASGTTNTFNGTLQNTIGALALIKEGAGSLTLAGTNTHGGGTTLNSGNINPKNGFVFGSGPVTANGGTIYSTTTMTVTNALTMNGGTLRIGGGAGKALTWTGPVNVTANSTLKADGSTTGLTLTGPLNMNNGGHTLTCSIDGGGIANTLAGPISGSSGSITVTGGKLTLSASNSFAGNLVVNAGTLALTGGARIPSVANVIVAPGAIFSVSGLSPVFTWSPGQTLSNSAAGGILSGTNDCSSGTVSLLFDGLNPCLVMTNGGMRLAATTIFKVNNTGPNLVAGNYNLISAATAGSRGLVAGALPAVSVTGNGANGLVALQINPSGGLDLVVSAIASNPVNLNFTFNGSSLNLTWPPDHLGWIAQSNAVSLANSNQWFDIPGSQSTTNLSISPSAGNSNVFYRLRYPN
jgi:autotransporter-associated beta strand protein